MEENKVTETTVVAPSTPAPDYEAQIKSLQAELEKAKNAVTKANGEAAGYKRQLSERMTAEEQAKLAREETEKAMRDELEKLRTERRVDKYTNRMMGLGLENEAAYNLSTNLPDGIPDSFFEGLKKVIADNSARIRAEALKEQPTPSIGLPPSAVEAVSEEDRALRRAFGL